MKVLVINTVPTEKNGITNVIFNYLGAMDLDGIQIDYLSINQPDNNYATKVKSRGGNVFVVKRTSRCLFSYILNLKTIISKEKYHIVHIHGNSHTTVVDLFSAWLSGCKVRIIHCHNTTCSSPVLHSLLSPLFNLLYTNGLACGEDAGQWMFGKRPFVVLNNGVDTEKFAFNLEKRMIIRNNLGLQHDNILVGHVGLFNEQKNHVFLVKVFKELFCKDNRYRLLLIGDGELRPLIEKQVEEMGLNGVVIFTGSITNVSDYLNCIDIILMPSLYEGLPLALVEQQVNGLHCVVSDTISKEADKTGNLVFLSLSSSTDRWAEEIININTGEREDISKKSIERIKEAGYSIRTEAEKLEKFYRDACRNVLGK